MERNNEKNFWEKMLFANKVKRILEKLEIDSEAFQKEYENDTTRPRRGVAVPTDNEVEAVETFLQTNDYASFLKTIGAKSRVKADSTLRRVLTWRGAEQDEITVDA